jgi:HAD superfamily hydrolase (TIGR01509 family)
MSGLTLAPGGSGEAAMSVASVVRSTFELPAAHDSLFIPLLPELFYVFCAITPAATEPWPRPKARSPDDEPFNMTSPAFEVILFDLGGVLVHFDGITPLLALSGNRLEPEDARRFWLASPAVRRFETGRCTPEEFALGAVAELGLAMAPALFLEQFLTWDRGPMDQALSLLDSLRPHFLLACLSNNNELHWHRLRTETCLAAKFHRCYLSHEIGLMKPDREAFDYVVRDLGIRSAHILFFDDNPECVETARRLGFGAHQARGVREVQAVLSSLLG